ncbi:MAG TPA: hypothetical protein PLQ92_06305 [Methanomassiliicoccales archaeon]|mgnify:CR=1 FL=1|nr:hypothetical protein [Methanomassiliicoccales archaeon]
MNPRGRWFLWRLVLSAFLIPLSLFLFTLDWNLGLFVPGLWLIAAICFVVAIAIWFYHRPQSHYGREEGTMNGPRTQHEIRRDTKIQREKELVNVRMDQHMFDRRW